MIYILTDTYDEKSEMKLIVCASENFNEIAKFAFDYKEVLTKEIEVWEKEKNIASVYANIKYNITSSKDKHTKNSYTYEEYRDLLWSMIKDACSAFHDIPVKI